MISYNDYYPFGSLIPGRHGNSASYRYGFNGKELDNELKGDGNSLDFGARMYDSRIGRWFAPDALEHKYPYFSTYSYAANNPIIFIDPDGNEIIIYYKDGNKEKSFKYKPGITPPNNEFVKNTVNSLNKLIQKEAFKDIEIEGKINPNDRLLAIVNDKRALSIIEVYKKDENKNSFYLDGDYVPTTFKPTEGEYGEFDPRSGGFGTIRSNDLYGIEFKNDDGTQGYNSPTSILGHEIIHAIHKEESNDKYRDRKRKSVHSKGILPEEDQATKDADKVNKKLGESQRKDYHKKTTDKKVVKTNKPTTDMKKINSSRKFKG